MEMTLAALSLLRISCRGHRDDCTREHDLLHTSLSLHYWITRIARAKPSCPTNTSA